MKILYSKSILAFLLLTATFCQAMHQKPIIVTIPGQDGKGSRITAEQLFGHIDFAANTPDLKTARHTVDLGQDNSQRMLDETMQQALEQSKNENRKLVIIASSQGVGTLINWCAKHVENSNTIEAIVTEGGMLSGNKTVMHKISTGTDLKSYLARLPFAYYWGPYLVKYAQFTGYSVSGEQPIQNVQFLPKNALVVITHHKDDYTVPFDNAQALYGGLLESGHKKAYLIPVQQETPDDKPCHINILYNPENIADLNEPTPQERHTLHENSYTKYVRALLKQYGVSGLTQPETRRSDLTGIPDLDLDNNPDTDEITCKKKYKQLLNHERYVAATRYVAPAIMGLSSLAGYLTVNYLAQKNK